MYGNGAAMGRGRTRRIQRLIRWDQPMLMPIVSSEVGAGTTPHVACGQPTATPSSSTFITTFLASAAHVQEDGGKGISSALVPWVKRPASDHGSASPRCFS